MIDKKYIDKVLDEVDLAEVVSDYGVKLQLRGHTAKDAALSIRRTHPRSTLTRPRTYTTVSDVARVATSSTL